MAKGESRARKPRIIVTAGHQGATVSILPRDGHPTQAQAQWGDPTSRRRIRRTVAGVAIPASGKVTREQRTHLQSLATLLHSRLAGGRLMPGDRAGPSWASLLEQAKPADEQVPHKASDRITVREALAVAYGQSYAAEKNARGRISGRYIRSIKGQASGGAAVSRWTDHARDLRRIADVVETTLGPDQPWAWSHAAYTSLRDALIDDVVRTSTTTEAPLRLRRVQKALQVYIRATRLAEKAYHDRDDLSEKPKALTVERWLTDLKGTWTARGLVPPSGQQPRYDRYEAAQIYMEGISPRQDPRYGLWLTLGLEGRPVQILRARRSHLEDRLVDSPRGVFRGPGTQRKHGLTYAPTPAHRLMIDQYLNGFLREYEQRYLAREITDYPLFPSGVTVDDVIPFRPNARPWGYRQFLGRPSESTGFYRIEREAGVGNVPNRGPYAMKYTVADLTPFIAGKLGIADAVAINLATAHDTPGTAPQYRQNARLQSSMLVLVGRIVWGVRKEFRTLAAQGLLRSVAGVEPEGERIAAYQMNGEGVTLRLVSGGGLWIPWTALELAGVVKLLNPLVIANMRERHEVDDEARELQFSGVRAVLKVDAMLERAKTNEANDPSDVVLLAEVPRW